VAVSVAAPPLVEIVTEIRLLQRRAQALVAVNGHGWAYPVVLALLVAMALVASVPQPASQNSSGGKERLGNTPHLRYSSCRNRDGNLWRVMRP
jgi:hypothetical protein